MLLNRAQIQNFVEERYCKRGQEYYRDGMIKMLSSDKESVKAWVVGENIYSVTLILKNGRLSGDCSCIAFSDYGPCKHIAATGFAIIDYNQGLYEPSEECVERIEEYHEFETILRRKSKEQLIKMIIQMQTAYPDIIHEYFE